MMIEAVSVPRPREVNGSGCGYASTQGLVCAIHRGVRVIDKTVVGARCPLAVSFGR